jgi:hypothetical protein
MKTVLKLMMSRAILRTVKTMPGLFQVSLRALNAIGLSPLMKATYLVGWVKSGG